MRRPPERWCFAPISEVDFEPLLALRIDVMPEHLERVFRYEPALARRIFREQFDEPGLRLILVDGQRRGCVGFRLGETDIRSIRSISSGDCTIGGWVPPS